MSLEVGEVDAEVVRTFLADRPDSSHQQWPSWARAKAEWGHLLLGWYDAGTLVGTGLVLRRRLPGGRWTFDYLPEGPIIDWAIYRAADILRPLAAFLRPRGSVTVKVGARLAIRRWSREALLAGQAEGALRWRDVAPTAVHDDVVALAASFRALGLRPYEAPSAAFGGTLQPRYGVEVGLAGVAPDAVDRLASSSFRRNVAKARKAGVTVRVGSADDIPTLQALLVDSGARDGFVPRGVEYFQRMYDAMTAESPTRVRLHLAERDGEPLAAALRVTSGDRSAYTYGGAAPSGYDVRASNALQWDMVEAAVADGRALHDLRGVTDSLDPADHRWGLTRFKLDMGGEAVEYLGEWDLPVRRLQSAALSRYLNRRVES